MRDNESGVPAIDHAERVRLSALCRRQPQWRKFAEELAEGKAPIDAYKAAGYVPHRGNCYRLLRRAEVQAYLGDLLDEAAEFAGVRRLAVINRIDRVGRANVADFYESDGVTLKNIKDLPRELTDALAGIERDEDGRLKLKFWDKNQANLTLLKYFGGLPEQEPTRVNVNLFSALPLDDQQALAELIEALPGGAREGGGGAAGERPPA